MGDSNQLRKDTLGIRNNLSPQDLQVKSTAIIDRLLSQPEIVESSSIFMYVSFRSEVDTKGLLKTLIGMGKTVSVPLTYVKERRIDAIRITSPENQLVPGYCDIPEPRKEILSSNCISPDMLDAIILPGSVFDERCGRFGYGGGFYDRFVSQVPQAHRIGLAFDLQVVPLAPLQAHDELLDIVVTETRVIRGTR